MNDTMLTGAALWLLIFYPVWSPRLRRKRRMAREARQRAGVSRNQTGQQSGPAWEQDYPWPECFEEEEE